tara:strand:- start:1435 stop:1647 length:213 start_codon:yes stop_codon:yes gene_type:complete
MPTISISLTDGEFTTLQKALLQTDGAMGDTESSFTEAVVKEKIVAFLKNKVETYDRVKNVTVNYTSFTPS